MKTEVDGVEHDTLSLEGCTSSPACRRRSRSFVFLPGHEMCGVWVRSQNVEVLRWVEGGDETSTLLGKRKDRTKNIA